MNLTWHKRNIIKKFKKHNIDNPSLSAQLILEYALKLDRVNIYLSNDREINEKEENIINSFVKRRLQHEPIAYILGHKEFYSYDFLVNKFTLIPRPETELLIEKALSLLPENKITFCDYGTGCGCIGITLALERPKWEGFLIDSEKKTLEITKKNINKYKLHNVKAINSDIFHPSLKPNSVDLIISNPPYISENEKELVMQDVIDFEPHSALFSKENGLNHICSIIENAQYCLKNNGYIILEHGFKQAEKVKKSLEKNFFTEIKVYSDLSGLDRCTLAKKIS